MCLEEPRPNEFKLDDHFRAYNATVPRQIALEAELKRRDGDQRRAMLSLLEHLNMQVRLNAARAADPWHRRRRDECCSRCRLAPSSYVGRRWNVDPVLGSGHLETGLSREGACPGDLQAQSLVFGSSPTPMPVARTPPARPRTRRARSSRRRDR
ncbi:DUF2019 domain-containing protein [Aurantimonas aggregata]|uniref:DUF2019 domain-containing protein n=1 Tax=Aurantimonas aggregata TaxID=2047720 RepID=A0A6L9MEJ7_9HYPH|nr:DUF2019 domain-containing protein [Aurantimonas aggregata]